VSINLNRGDTIAHNKNLLKEIQCIFKPNNTMIKNYCDIISESSNISPRLELKEITKKFGGIVAVDRASLTFSAGKVTGLIGPNGAGKTTVFNLITGFLKPDAGTIYLRDHPINGLPAWRIAQLGIGRLFQDVRVFNKLTVLENLLLAKKDQLGENPLVSLWQRKKVLKAEKKNIEEARRWLKLVGLEEKENSLAENLSYGQQKLLSIARLLAGGSEILLLDEPTAGINPQIAKSLLAIIKQLSQEGKTVVVIEHNMSVILEISDWVFFMNEGKVISFGLPEEILGDPEIRKTYIGI